MTIVHRDLIRLSIEVKQYNDEAEICETKES